MTATPLKDSIKSSYAFANKRYPTKMKILRYIVSGGTAAFVDVALLYLFTDIFKIWYIISATIAFLFAFVVSFSLQKYWTFNDRSNERVSAQAALYFAVTTTNLGLNTLGIFLCVEYGHVHYILSQIIVSALIAVESYFVYHFVFKQAGLSSGSN